jgi:hypothetical protein
MKDTDGNGKQLYLVFCFSDPDKPDIFSSNACGKISVPRVQSAGGEFKPMGLRLQGKRHPLLASMNEHDADGLRPVSTAVFSPWG